MNPIDESVFLRMLLPLVIAMPRLLGLVFGLEILQRRVVPGVARSGACMAIALFVYPTIHTTLPEQLPTSLPLTLLLLKEFVLGLSIGSAFGLIIHTFENVGGLIDAESGMSNAAIMDPLSGNQIGPSSAFLKQFALTLLVVSGVLGHLIVQVAHSYSWWTWDSYFPRFELFDIERWLMNLTGTFWELSVKLAGPVIVILLLVELGLALINRITPQFDVMTAAMPVKSLVSMLVIALAITFWVDTLLQHMREDMAFLRNLFQR